MKIYINGSIADEKDAKISVFDHGFLYGDGIFETLRAENGKIFRLDMYMTRLYRSAKFIGLEIPLAKEEMKDAVKKTLAANSFMNARIRITVTRGIGDIGYGAKCEPNIVIMVTEQKPYPELIYKEGVKVMTASYERDIPEAKTTNCMMLGILQRKADEVGAHEALLLNKNDEVTEGISTNIFIVKDDAVITPAKGMLEGVTRYILIEQIKASNITIEQRAIKKEELYTADEIFITSTTRKIVPVVEVDGRKISDGKPGKYYVILSQKFSKI